MFVLDIHEYVFSIIDVGGTQEIKHNPARMPHNDGVARLIT
jgi:hypothetical protein